MAKENISQQFILTNIEETNNYFIKKINQNDLMSKNHKKVATVLDFIEHLLILASAVAGCVSIGDFASLVGIPIGSPCFALGIKT